MNRYAIIYLLALISCLPSWAGDNPEAVKWLNKVAQTFEAGPLSMDFLVAMNTQAQAMGQVSLNVRAKMLFLDKNTQHIRAKLNINMQGSPIAGELLFVMDGKTMWLESKSMGATQVVTLPLSQIDQMASARNGMFIDPRTITPATIVALIQEHLDLSFAGEANGVATLTANLSDSYKQQIGLDGSPLAQGIDQFAMTVDSANTFPVNISFLNGTRPMFQLKMSNLKHLKPAQLDRKMFRYKPPRGVKVQDLSKTARRR